MKYLLLAAEVSVRKDDKISYIYFRITGNLSTKKANLKIGLRLILKVIVSNNKT